MPINYKKRKESEITANNELKKLLENDDFSKDLREIVEDVEGIVPKTGIILDYQKIKFECDDNAAKIVNSMASMYLTENAIKNVPYVTNKLCVDIITLSNLLFQMDTAKQAMIKLFEEIDSGNIQPRTFEVLSQMQKSNMEISKHLNQFMITMESNYKTLREDHRNIRNDDELATTNEFEIVEPKFVDKDVPKMYQMKGPKDMLKLIQSVKTENERISKESK